MGDQDNHGMDNEVRRRTNRPLDAPIELSNAPGIVRFVEEETKPPAEEVEKVEKDSNAAKKTYGRTPDGTVFTVPQTHDMVSELLSPTQPKNTSDYVVIGILGLHILLLFRLPAHLRTPVLCALFLFWRSAYNAGIGVLLHLQSADRRLVTWARKSRIFESPDTGKNPRPMLFYFLKHELETKIPNDYRIESAPTEYNTWLVFRRLVDLILMCDFVSYCLFAISCFTHPQSEGVFMTIGRWVVGIALFLFNVWVKLDAHRVVKDYAWYWGDFFFLVDQELTFDGVFEMAPHPMYSVGYAGYYGISLMAASYKVFFISILAHAAQFAFLILVENPHIDKIYNAPPPRRQVQQGAGDEGEDSDHIIAFEDRDYSIGPSSIYQILGSGFFDLHRQVNVSVVVCAGYLAIIALITPQKPLYQVGFVLHAVFWRLWFTFRIGYILTTQSEDKAWTRHFIKIGESVQDGWKEWKAQYFLAMTMCYMSFAAASYKMYNMSADWSYGLGLLRHVVGVLLIVLHTWTVVSIYDSLGEFGFFYGDFFWDRGAKLTYGGIYRFLNNPERILGLAGLWGFAIITWSRAMFVLATVSHILTISFIQFVERPHMQRLYGQEELRGQSGLSKSIRRSLPPPIRKWQGTVDRGLEQTAEFIEEFIEAARPKLAAGVETFVRDATKVFSNYPAQISISRVSDDMVGHDPKDYTIDIEGTPASALAELDHRSGREGEAARTPPLRTSNFRTQLYEYGAPIKVCWRAPLNHGKKDWIGLYMVSENADRLVTRISSRGRWTATNPGEYVSSRADVGILSSDVRVDPDSDGEVAHYEGEAVFEGDKLWWTPGSFEFRYHHDGKHNVMAISHPFEIRIAKFDEDDVEVDSNGSLRGAVEQALLPVVRNCLDRDPDIAPNTVEEAFGGLVERESKYAKRIVFAVHQMFGIELAPEVVQADGTVKNLAWRICNAKKALVRETLSRYESTQLTSRRRRTACRRQQLVEAHRARRVTDWKGRVLAGAVVLPMALKSLHSHSTSLKLERYQRKSTAIY
jgi:phosphatidylethanolamine N-methyltransferase